MTEEEYRKLREEVAKEIEEDERKLNIYLANIEDETLRDQVRELEEKGVLFFVTEVEPPHVSVNCNDLFAWGCADYEDIDLSEIPTLYTMWKEKHSGDTLWVCQKRNERPQYPIVQRLKEQGHWNEEWEALGKNTTNAEVHAIFGLKAPEEKTA